MNYIFTTLAKLENIEAPYGPVWRERSATGKNFLRLYYQWMMRNRWGVYKFWKSAITIAGLLNLFWDFQWNFPLIGPFQNYKNPISPTLPPRPKKNPGLTARLRGTLKIGIEIHVAQGCEATYSICMFPAGWPLNFCRTILAFIDSRRPSICITGERARVDTNLGHLFKQRGLKLDSDSIPANKITHPRIPLLLYL